MKKKATYSVVLITLVLLGLTSCTKDWTCTCKSLGYTIPSTITDKTHKDAKVDCDNAENTYKFVDASASCTLK
jgi:hypothetical protein